MTDVGAPEPVQEQDQTTKALVVIGERVYGCSRRGNVADRSQSLAERELITGIMRIEIQTTEG